MGTETGGAAEGAVVKGAGDRPAATDPWIPVGDLARGFEPEADVMPPTDHLVGRSIRLHLEDGSALEYRFDTAESLTWGAPDLGGGGVVESYRAVEVREHLFFVDHLRHHEPATSVSLVLDLGRGICTAVVGRLPDREQAEGALLRRSGQGLDLTAVTVDFLHAAVDAPFTGDTPRHMPTTDLIGKRVQYTYSPTEQYEHIYLNENLYTWHCLRGVEKGLADTDRCHYYGLADRLYLFVWREKLVPTLGVVVADYAAGRSNGKIFGYEGGDYAAVANFPIGARGRVLNVTTGE